MRKILMNVNSVMKIFITKLHIKWMILWLTVKFVLYMSILSTATLHFNLRKTSKIVCCQLQAFIPLHAIKLRAIELDWSCAKMPVIFWIIMFYCEFGDFKLHSLEPIHQHITAVKNKSRTIICLFMTRCKLALPVSQCIVKGDYYACT